MQSLRNQVVVLTGASSGIGRAAALEFAKSGCKLALAARDAQALHEVAEECRKLGAEASPVPTDVTNEGAMYALRDTALASYGRIDVWVNDAAAYAMGKVEETPSEVYRRILDTNVMGVLYGTRAALEAFRRQGSGTIINIGSVAGRAPYAKASAYCASKHAVHAITEALRQELVGTNIEACLIVPATVDTPLFQHAANFTGREVVAMPPVYAPERVARAIVSCARRPRRMVTVGATPRATWFNRVLMPGVYERAQPKLVEKTHLGEHAIQPTRGNLDRPLPPHQVEGGWNHRRMRLAPAAVAALAAATALVVLGVSRT